MVYWLLINFVIFKTIRLRTIHIFSYLIIMFIVLFSCSSITKIYCNFINISKNLIIFNDFVFSQINNFTCLFCIQKNILQIINFSFNVTVNNFIFRNTLVNNQISTIYQLSFGWFNWFVFLIFSKLVLFLKTKI